MDRAKRLAALRAKKLAKERRENGAEAAGTAAPQDNEGPAKKRARISEDGSSVVATPTARGEGADAEGEENTAEEPSVIAPAQALEEVQEAENQAAVEEEMAKEAKLGEGDEVDILSLAPKKINWDLKEAVQPRLDKLERRTQRAILALIKERMGSQ